ncbi:acyltransferase, partial [Thioclava sp. BHET1]
MTLRDARSALPRSALRGGAHLHRLDLMRFIAASLVVLFHFASFGFDSPEQDAAVAAQAFPWLHPWGWFGWIGVPVFFCLSGYVIARSALDQSPLAFLKRRLIRILPMLWIGALMAFAIRLIWGQDVTILLPDLLRNAVLSPKGPYIDGVVWTLVLEAVFYLMIMGLLAFASDRAARIALFGRFALWLGGLSTLFIALLAGAMLGGWQIGGHELAALLTRFPFKVALLHHGVYFAIGMMLWLREEEALPRPGLALLGLFTLAGLA